MARCSESFPGKTLKWRETKLDKAQLETEELSLRNRSLTQEIVQVESRIQDLCEDLAKKLNCACSDGKNLDTPTHLIGIWVKNK